MGAKQVVTVMRCELALIDAFATAAMQARLTAAWSNTGPTVEAWNKSKLNRAPDSEEPSFNEWIAEAAYEQAREMWRVRYAFHKSVGVETGQDAAPSDSGASA